MSWRTRLMSAIVSVILAAPLVLCLGCESDGDSDDDGFFGIGGSDDDRATDRDYSDDVISSDRDASRNSDNTGRIEGLGEPGDRELPRGEDNWLRNGSGGIGGADDTGAGTGRP